MLHYATYGIIREALERIGRLDCVRDRPVLLRVEDIP